MASKDERTEGNFLQEALGRIRERYVEEYGEEPSDEFMEEARRKIILEVARQDRDEHREIYDALAEE